MTEYRFTSAALVELKAATQYYEEQENGLGAAFLDEIDAAVERILANPQAWHPLSARMKNDARQSHSMYLEECDCKQQRFRILQTTNYDRQGNVISANQTVTEWGHVVPDTLSKRIYDVLCGKALDQETHDVFRASFEFSNAREAEKKGQLEDAKSSYETALEFAPDNLKILTSLSRVNKALSERKGKLP